MSLAMSETPLPEVPQTERTLLIVEDDKSFLQRLARAMEARGFVVRTAESVGEGLQQVEASAPAFAVVDMRLGDGNGLDVVSALKQRRPEARAPDMPNHGLVLEPGRIGLDDRDVARVARLVEVELHDHVPHGRVRVLAQTG